jgi:hypothetical protein
MEFCCVFDISILLIGVAANVIASKTQDKNMLPNVPLLISRGFISFNLKNKNCFIY